MLVRSLQPTLRNMEHSRVTPWPVEQTAGVYRHVRAFAYKGRAGGIRAHKRVSRHAVSQDPGGGARVAGVFVCIVLFDFRVSENSD